MMKNITREVTMQILTSTKQKTLLSDVVMTWGRRDSEDGGSSLSPRDSAEQYSESWGHFLNRPTMNEGKGRFEMRRWVLTDDHRPTETGKILKECIRTCDLSGFNWSINIETQYPLETRSCQTFFWLVKRGGVAGMSITVGTVWLETPTVSVILHSVNSLRLWGQCRHLI